MPVIEMKDELYNILQPRWINSIPLIVATSEKDEDELNLYIINEMLNGKVILLDFWEYTCINCLRTLPYVKEWHKRYADKGLVVIGVHTPEFSVSVERKNVENAVKELGITYPVVLDSDYAIWTSLHNQYWPRKLLFNSKLEIVYDSAGEGGYREAEIKIQQALLELDGTLKMPPIMEPVRDADMEGTHCYPATPELYCGFVRGRLGNTEGYNKDSNPVVYSMPETLTSGMLYLNGTWASTEESIIATELPANIEIIYKAAQINAVISSASSEPIKVYIEINGASISKHDKGDDILYDQRGSYVLVDKPKMYNITGNQPYREYDIKIFPDNIALEFFAFTFVSCVEPH